MSRDIRAICTSPANRPLLCEDALPALGHDGSSPQGRSRITPEARRVAERVFASLHKLNEDTRSLMISSGRRPFHQQAPREEMVDQKSPPCVLSLLKGAMT